MNVLLTGGNGFLGSHVLDRLLADGHVVRLLLRNTSDTTHIRPHLDAVEVRYGELRDPASLKRAVDGVEAVVHCAAKTTAVHCRTYYEVNAGGTRNLVRACAARGDGLRRFVQVSSLSVTGPGTVAHPAREDDRPRPVSHYGRSKRLAERYVRRMRTPHVILRPAAVYGPRDTDFFTAFKMVQQGLMPLIDGGRQLFSLIYAPDAARAVARALTSAAAPGHTYHVANPDPLPQRQFLECMAGAMGARPLRIPLPHLLLYPVCLVQEAIARVSGRAGILNLQKIPEYAAAGWVCSTAAAAQDLDFTAGTGVREGVKATYEWYTGHGWLESP